MYISSMNGSNFLQNVALGAFITADTSLIVYTLGPIKSRPFTMALHSVIGKILGWVGGGQYFLGKISKGYTILGFSKICLGGPLSFPFIRKFLFGNIVFLSLFQHPSCIPVFVSVCLCVTMSICLSVYLSNCLFNIVLCKELCYYFRVSHSRSYVFILFHPLLLSF